MGLFKKLKKFAHKVGHIGEKVAKHTMPTPKNLKKVGSVMKKSPEAQAAKFVASGQKKALGKLQKRAPGLGLPPTP